MKRSLRNCIITSQDGDNYIVERREIFLLIWRLRLERGPNLTHITSCENKVNLYMSKNVCRIINLCTIPAVAFSCYVAFPLAMKLVMILPANPWVDVVLATVLGGCSARSMYVFKAMLASLLVPHVRWLTLEQNEELVDLQFKIEQNKSASMSFVRLVCFIEIIVFFIVVFVFYYNSKYSFVLR